MADINSIDYIQRVNFWCNKIVPLVYTDELSYIELLAKVREKINELIKNNNNLPDYIYNQILTYVSGEGFESVVANLLSNYMINVKYPPLPDIAPASGNGSTDDTLTIQACIDFAHERGINTIYIPSGKYLISSLDIKGKTTIINGDSELSTYLVTNGVTTNPLIYSSVPCDSTTGLEIKNITLDGNSGAVANHNHNIVLDKVGDFKLYNVSVINSGITAIGTNDCDNVRLDNIKIANFGGIGLLIDCEGTKNTNVICNNIEIINNSTIAQHSISISTSNGFYNNIKLNVVTGGVNCAGRNNVFIYTVTGASTPDLTDSGDKNIFISTDKVNINCGDNLTLQSGNGLNTTALLGDTVINSTVGKTILAGTGGVNIISSTDISIEPKNNTNLNGNVKIKNPLTYNQTPTDISPYFKTVPIIDKNGTTQNVLLATDTTKQLAEIKTANTHFRYYVDGVNGNDNNDGMTSATAFKTLDKLFGLLAKGETEIRCFIITKGTYLINNLNTVNGVTIHITGVEGTEIYFTNPLPVAFYNSHVNFNTIKINSAAMDNDNYDYGVYYENTTVAHTNVTQIGRTVFWGCMINSTGSFYDSVDCLGCNGVFTKPTITNTKPNVTAFNFSKGSNIVITGSVGVTSLTTAGTGDNSRFIFTNGSTLSLQSGLVETENPYNYGIVSEYSLIFITPARLNAYQSRTVKGNSDLGLTYFITASNTVS